MSPSRKGAAVFYGWCALTWIFFCVICSYSSVLLDDWYQVVYWKWHAFSLGALWDNAVYNYNHYNPRLGENFLLLVNGPRIFHLLLTPSVEMLLLFVMFGVTFGRWPRANTEDTRRMFFLLVVLWMVAPVPGIMWFYRPFTTNYVYAFALTLLLIVPYRFELARAAPADRSGWLAPLIFLCGVAAGMTNEHTGPTAILALGAVVYLLWRKFGRLRPWMIAGLVGLCIGYPLLYFAPGQSERYGGLATRMGPLDIMIERGARGTLDVLRSFIWECQLAIYIITGAILLSRRRRDGQPPPMPDKPQVLAMAFLVVSSLLIVMTLFASPTWGERLFFAPAVLLAAALTIFIDVLVTVPAARRLILCTAVVTFTYHAVRLVMIYPKEYAENEERIAAILATPPGSFAYVKPYAATRSPWMNSDDFGYSSLREYIAHEFAGIAGIEIDRVVHGEPTPPYHMELEYAFDPPLAKAEVEKHVVFPLTYVPSYVDRNVQVIRRILPQLRSIPGHRLLSVTAVVRGLELPVLRGRPLLGVRWHDDKFDLIDVRRSYDDQGNLYWLIGDKALPPGLAETYMVECGEAKELPMTRDDEGRGWRMTFDYTCRGIYIQILCTQAECWLATTAYR